MSIDKITESAIAISEVLTEAQINTRASQERVRRQTKPKKALNTFKVGDRVWRQNIRSQQRKGDKLEANCHVLTSLGLVRPVTRVKIKLENHDTPPLLSQLKDHNRFIKS